MSKRASSQLMVFMFTDLVDSSALARQLGDADYVRYVLEPHNDVFRGLLAEYQGAKEVKHTGDGFMAAFNSSSDAAECGLRLHQALLTATWERIEPRTRVGIHLGEAIEFEGSRDGERDWAGDAANMTARVMSLAEPGQTLMSRVAFDSARQSGRLRADLFDTNSTLSEIQWLNHGHYRMKGADEPLEVCEVGVLGLAPLRPPASSEKARRVVNDEEIELLGWRPSPNSAIPHRPDWILDKSLGEGAFGEVWLAHHKRTRDQRAFKFCFDAYRLRSFKRELTFFRLIRDSLGERRDIGRLYEVQMDRPPFFLEGEYIADGNLKQWSDAQGGIWTLPLEMRLRLLIGTAQAVAAAHSLGIIHKDIKPSNVLIAERNGEPQPMLVDFGIGVLTDRTLLKEHQITETGFTESLSPGHESSRSGTRMYQPPEAQLNRPATMAGDVYALGVMLYQLVIGDLSLPLGTGWEDEVTDELLRDDIHECTYRDPERRLESAAELARRLIALPERRATREMQLQERDAREQRLRWTRRAFRISTVAAIIILIVGLSVSAYYWRESVIQAGIAVEKREEADEQRGVAIANAIEAEANAKEALKNEFVAELNATLQGIATEVSKQQGEIAEKRRKEANEARELAKKAERETREEAYLSLVSDAAAGIEENSFQEAKDLLTLAKKLESMETTKDSDAGADVQLQPWLTQELNKTLTEWLAKAEADEIDATAEVKEKVADFGRKLEQQLRNEQTADANEPEKPLRVRNWEWGHLWHLAHQGPRSIEARTRLDVVAFAPDGEHFITGGEDGKVRWWRLRDAVDVPDDAPAVAPVNEELAVNGYVFAASFFRPSATTNDIEPFVEDFTYLAIGSNDPAAYVRLWKWNSKQSAFPSGDPQILLHGHQDAVTSVNFSHDGKLLLTSSYDGTSRVWGVTDGKLLATQRGHEGPVWDAAFAPGENSLRRFATVGDDGAAIVWELDQPWNESNSSAPKDPEWKLHWEAKGNHYGAVHAVRFLADGNRFVTAGQDGRIVVWNPPPANSSTDEVVNTAAVAQRTLSGHTGAVRSLKLLSDIMLLSCADDNTMRLWNIETTQTMRVLRGHSSLVRSCDSSPSEDPAMQWVLSGSHDQTAKLWRIAAHREAHVFGAYMFQDHEEGVLAAAFANDGQRFVTAGLDRQGNVHTLSESMEEEGLLGDKQVTLSEGHRFAIRDAKFHEDGRLLTSSIDRSVRIWSRQGHELATLPATGRLGAIAVSRNWIATGSDSVRIENQNFFTARAISTWLDNYEMATLLRIDDAWGIKLWSGGTSQDRANPVLFLRTLGEVTTLAFSADGSRLFSGHADGRCMLWELQDGESPQLLWGAELRHKPTTESIIGAVFLSDEQVLAASKFGQMMVWNISTGEVLRTLPPPAIGESDNATFFLRDFAMASGVASKNLAVVFDKGPVWVSDLTGQGDWFPLHLPPTASSLSERRIANVDFSPNGKWLVASEPSETKAYVWDTAMLSVPPRVLAITETAAQSLNRLDAAYFDPTLGDELGVLTVSGTSARRWQYLGQKDAWPTNASWKELVRIGPHSEITSAEFSPRAKWIATAGLDEQVKIWDPEGNVVAALQHSDRINHVAWVTSNDRLQLLSASHDGYAHLWDLGPQDESSIRSDPSEVGKFGLESEEERQPVRIALAFTTAGGRRILTAGDDGKAFIWDESGTQIGPPVAEHTSAIMAAAVSADGSLLLTGSNDTTARLWNSDTGQPINHYGDEPIILRHTGPVISVAISPDGQRFITGSEDTTAKIWDRRTGRKLITLRGHARPVTSVAFQPNPQPNGKRYILTCSRDGATILWPADDWNDVP